MKTLSFPARLSLIVIVIVIALLAACALRPANAQGGTVGEPPTLQYRVAIPVVARSFDWATAKQCEAAIKLAPPVYDFPLPTAPRNALEAKCWPMVQMALVFGEFAPEGTPLDWTFSTSLSGSWKVAYIKVGDERIGYTFTRNSRDDVNAGVFYVQCKSEIDVVCGHVSPVARMVRVLGGITDPRYGSMGVQPVIWEKWQNFFQCETYEDGSQSCASSAYTTASVDQPPADDTPQDEVIE